MGSIRSIDAETFLGYLRQSGLASAEEIAQIRKRHPGQIRGRPLARALVEEGALTRFQAERILIGRTAGFVLGQYRILEQIGRGGMGRVYRAEHHTMKRIVALKVLASRLLQTERAIELFLHEIQAVAQIQHPNIVIAYDANQIQGRYFLVLEFVDGPNLEQLVRRQGPLSPGLACDYIRQSANGLQCAHKLGMVHRDVKPANILVQRHGLDGDSSPGLVKISDFGLARLGMPASAYQDFHGLGGTILTRENTVMGTPDYLSPEQTRNLHNADIRSDLYSLGCTFHFLLTGQVVFPGGTQVEKLIRHATEAPRQACEVRPGIPAEVQGIVDRLLAKTPEERFQTPAELAAALQPYAVSGPIPSAPAPTLSGELEMLHTPADPLGGSGESLNVEGDYPPPGSDAELLAIAPTLEDDLDSTPGPAAVVVKPPQGRGDRNARLRLAVTLAIGVVGTLLALAGVMAWVMR